VGNSCCVNCYFLVDELCGYVMGLVSFGLGLLILRPLTLFTFRSS
jgi:hypothetical protein